MPVRRCDVVSSKDYANEENLERAVQRMFGNKAADLRYHVAWTREGRCYPIFVGVACLQEGIHFHFPVMGG